MRTCVLKTALKIIAISALVFSVSACGSEKDANKSNFSKAIQAYLDTQNGLCAGLPAKSVPFTLSPPQMFNTDSIDRANALAAAGLLSTQKTEVKAMFGNKMDPATQYDLTEAGKKYLVTLGAGTLNQQAAFCTGKDKMVEVDTYTEPADMRGIKVSQVNYHYKVEDAADWAKVEGLRGVYKNFADYAKGDIQAKAVLILTGDGWMHERLFKR
jgi:hypothetical protein